MSDFFSKTLSDNFKRVLIYGKDQESRNKIFRNRAKNIHFLRTFDYKKQGFLDSEKTNSKRLFSMTLNARQSQDSLLKIKTDYNRAKF